MKKSNKTIARKSLGRVEISTIAALGLLGVGVEAAAQSATDNPLDSIDGVTGYEILPNDSLLITLESGETLTLAADAYVIVGEQVFLREDGAAILQAALAGGVDAALLLGGAFAGLSGVIAATDDGGDDGATPPSDTTPPSFTSDATASTAENVSTDTVVYDANATDANTITYSLSGADADFFEIDSDTGEVTFIDSPDFEAEADANGDNVFEITITASDGTNSSSLDVAITLTDLDDEAPVITSEASATVVENPADGQVVYTATATDVDSETVTFSLAGADADLFEIDASSGEVSFVGSPDYDDAGDADGDNVYEIQIVASDGTNSSTQTVEITVTDVNDEAPVFTSATSATAVPEDETDTIYTAKVSDLDTDLDSITYRLADSGDSQYVNIDPDTGAVTLGSLIDHENPLDDGKDNSYTTEIIASDGSNETTHTVTIEIADVADEGPVFTSGATASVEEASTNTNYIPHATPDLAGSTVTYAITGGADGALFELDDDSGMLTLVFGKNHERPIDAADPATGAIAGDNVYEVEITATDEDGNQTSRLVNVTVTDITETAPSFTSGTAISVDENESDTGYIANAVPDVESLDVTYALTGGADEAQFKIDSETGKLSFADGFTPDYESPGDGGGSSAVDNVYEVEITATDEDGAKSTQLVHVTVNDVDDEAPVFTSSTNPSAVPEDETDVVYVAEATDPDSDDGDITYALADGGDNQFFNIDADTGQVTLRATIDHDTANDADGDHVYDIQIIASDGTNSSTHDVAITITDAADEDPVFTTGTTASVDEGKTITDYMPEAIPDVDGTPVTYKIVGGAHGHLFDIDDTTGKLVFKDTPDFEAPFEGYATTHNAYYVIGDTGPDFLDFEGGLIEDEDGDGYLDPGEAVTITSARGTITSHSFVGTVEIDGHTFVATTSGASGNPADGEELIFWVPFGVDPDTINFPDVDDLRALLNSDAFSDEAFSIRPDNQYEVTIEASDDTNTSTQTVTVTVNDVDEDAPVFSNTETDVSVAENTDSSTVVFNANATDPNGPDADIKYSLSGDDADAFDINEDTGVVTFKDTLPAPDHEAPADADQNGEYKITITATDSENKSTDLAVTITIDDVSETGPAFTSATTVSVNENETETGYTPQATPDVDGADVKYKVFGGAHGHLFDIDPNTGELVFINAPDHEAFTVGVRSHGFFVISSADGSASSFQPYPELISEGRWTTIGVDDGWLEPGEGMSFNGHDYGDTYAGTVTIAGVTLIVSNDDIGGYNVYVPAGIDPDSITFPDDFSELTLSTDPYQLPVSNEFEVTIQAFDGTNTSTHTVYVTVNDVSDNAPTFASDFAVGSVDENETATDYTATATPDVDGAEVTYSIVSGAHRHLFDINETTGEVSFKTAPDHEAPTHAWRAGTYAFWSNGDIAGTPDFAGSYTESLLITESVFVNDEDWDGVLEVGDVIFIGGGNSEYEFYGTLENNGHTLIVARKQTANGAEFVIYGPEGSNPGDLSGLFLNDVDQSPFSLSTTNEYQIVVKAEEGNKASYQTVTISVEDTAEDGPVFTETTVSVNEGEQETGYTPVATPDLYGSTVTYKITGGADAARFTFDSAGQLVFVDTFTPDHENPGDAPAAGETEGNNVYEVELTARDEDGNETTQTVLVTVNDTPDEDPVFTSEPTVSVDENKVGVFHTVEAIPDVPGTQVKYDLNGPHQDLFQLGEESGELQFVTPPDYENRPLEYIALAFARYNANGGDLPIAGDENPAAIAEDPSAPSANGILTPGESVLVDGSAGFTYVGTVNIDGHTMIVTRLEIDGSLFIWSPTGVEVDPDIFPETFSLLDVTQEDYQLEPIDAYYVTIEAEDGYESSAQELVITLNNTADEGPTFNSGTTANLDENETETGYTPAADPDVAGSEVTYEITGGADEALFDLDADGQLVFVSAPDHETPGDVAGSTGARDNVYEVEITATDEDGNETVQTIEVTVNDIADEDPDFSSDATVSVSEGETETGYTADATPDIPGAPITYAITGGADIGLFDINASTGKVTFLNPPVFDANDASNNTYEIIVTATEKNGESATQTVSITVTEDPGVDLGDLATTAGVTLLGDADNALAGRSVSNAGDVNGDGIDDVIIGAPEQSVPGDGNDRPGMAYVVYGGQDLEQIDLDNLSPDQGFIVQGETQGDYLGISVAAAGDVNGDGYDDVIIGATGANFGDGAAYIIYGGPTLSSDNLIDVATMTASQGVTLDGAIFKSELGFSVSSAGDVNGDGIDDLIIGTTSGDQTYVIYGGQDFATIDLGALTSDQGFEIAGDSVYSNNSVSSAGDVNGDGYEDVLVGVPGASSGTGAVYLIFGGHNKDEIDLTNLDPADGIEILGQQPLAELGFSVSEAGDVNGDGFDDLIISAPSGYDNGENAGQIYVLYGSANPTSPNLAALTPGQGFTIRGADENDLAGHSVSNAGDVNGDGYDDLIIGAPGADPHGEDTGAAYVIYGGPDLGEIDLGDLTAAQGFVIEGANLNDETGDSVSSAGDVNGDGYDDLIVGDPQAKDGSEEPGAAYIIYGGATGTEDTTPLTLTGTDAADNLIGNAGNDLIDSVSTGDVARGGAGDDEIVVRGADVDFAEVDGGHGRDTLYMESSGLTLDIRAPQTRIENFEVIDLNNINDTALILDRLSVLRLSEDTSDGITTLKIIGEGEDRVEFADFGWAYGGTEGDYDIWQIGNARVLVKIGVKTDFSATQDPSITSDATASVDENVDTDHVVYDANASDGDSAQSDLTYRLANGGDNALFDIDATTGAVTFKASPDHETPADSDGQNDYEITVIVTDEHGNEDRKIVIITVDDLDEVAPVFTSDAAASIVEGTATTTAVYTAIATDEDNTGSGVSYSLKDAGDHALFDIDANGNVTFKASPTYNDGGDNTYDITLIASDGTNETEHTVTITVTEDISSDPGAPVITSQSTGSVDENDHRSTIVYDADATDPDGDASDLRYSLADGGDNDLFNIDTRTGEVKFNASPDHENPLDGDGNNDYEITVIVTDPDGKKDSLDVTITVNDIADAAPEFTSGSTASIDENQTNTGYFPAATPDGDGAAVRYEITGGVDRAQFDIHSTTGELIFVSAPDHEDPKDTGGANDDNVYEVRITATDETTGRETAQTVYVTVNDVDDEEPTFDSELNKSVDENTSGPVYQAVVTPDVEGTKVTYSLGDAGDSHLFTINKNTGDLSFNSPPDFEYPLDGNENNYYGASIVATIDGGDTITQTVFIQVVDVDDGDTRPPEFNAPSVVYVDEGALLAFEASATDPLSNDAPVGISITGEDAAALRTTSTNDNIYFWSAYRPDHENPTDNDGNNEYNITLSATNSRGETATHDVVIRIRDIADEAPRFTSESTASVSENETETGLFISATPDLDGADVTYSIVGGAHGYLFEIDPQTRELKFKEAPDFEAPPSAYEYDSVVEFRIASGNTSIDHNADGTRVISDDPESSTEGVLNPGDNIWIDGAPAGNFYGHITIGGHTMIVTSIPGSFDTTAGYRIYVPVGVDPDTINFDLGAVSRTAYELPKTNEYEVIIEAEEGGRATQQRITVTVEDVDETPAAAAANAGDLVDLLDNLESEVVSTPSDPNDGKTSPPITPVAPQLTPDWWPQDELASTLLQLDMSDALDGF
ncbi:MAG: cadherin domain-containing protein [Hyphomonadaceae bacterium]|nr:cadherin domain-containing protein [Hyphomonadaceae bacterium]